jgi:sugar (pentulose or hexulose) kinase
MTSLRHIAVFDVGKTNAKLVLVDAASLAELAVLTMPNRVLAGPPYPHFDADALWAFLLDGLRQFAARGVDAVTVTTHGASAALIGANGTLAAPILDYEFAGPDDLAAEYDLVRPGFTETGSPRLPMGLNLGAQLHWLARRHPDLLDKATQIVTLPGYWSGRLAGVYASDICSLGCHTDLWLPAKARFSDLVARLGLAEDMAPVMKPGTRLGPILPDVAAATGLAPETPVHLGIHDSNASLVPHLGGAGPRSVVSTGTWAIAMALGSGLPVLDEGRDTLINVDAFGRAVPSARFMGGREFERLDAEGETTLAAVHEVLTSRVMLLPSVVPGSGPFPGRVARWANAPEPDCDVRHVAVSWYLALMTATCLDLIGAEGPVVVEGPFASNDAYLRMLAAATLRVVHVTGSSSGTAAGITRLIAPGSAGGAVPLRIFTPEAALSAYAEHWLQVVGQ